MGRGRQLTRLHSQIEPNWPLPYSTVPVSLLRDAIGRQAGSPVSIFVQVHTMPMAQNRTGKGSILKENEIQCRSGL